jgi:hypothetical protein
VTEPRDHAAVGRGGLRASHDDRDRVIETLKAAFVQGRLTADELAERAGQALAARTYADLAALTADLPADRPVQRRSPRRPAPAPSRPARRRAPRPAAQAAAWGAAGAAGLAWPVLAAVVSGGNAHSDSVLFLSVTLGGFLYFIAWMLAGLVIFHSWLDDRARHRRTAQPPAGPGSSGSGPGARPLPRRPLQRRPGHNDHPGAQATVRPVRPLPGLVGS